MLTRIVHNSPKLCAFPAPLTESLSEPQRQHLRGFCEDGGRKMLGRKMNANHGYLHFFCRSFFCFLLLVVVEMFLQEKCPGVSRVTQAAPTTTGISCGISIARLESASAN